MSTEHTGPCLWMVCYKTSPDSFQTYWNVYPAERAEDATRCAERDGTLRTGVHHLWTVPYNKAGMTVEQTYAEHLAKVAPRLLSALIACVEAQQPMQQAHAAEQARAVIAEATGSTS